MLVAPVPCYYSLLPASTYKLDLVIIFLVLELLIALSSSPARLVVVWLTTMSTLHVEHAGYGDLTDQHRTATWTIANSCSTSTTAVA